MNFPASGDFTFVARVVTSAGTSNSRFAGVMVREDLRRNSRYVLVAQRGATLTQFYSRTATANTAANDDRPAWTSDAERELLRKFAESRGEQVATHDGGLKSKIKSAFS